MGHIDGWELARRGLRLINAAALPILLAWPLVGLLGGRSLTVWVASGFLGVWLVRRLQEASDWDMPYRIRFTMLVIFACDVSLTAAFLHSAFA
jgi:hypothetical protein